MVVMMWIVTVAMVMVMIWVTAVVGYGGGVMAEEAGEAVHDVGAELLSALGMTPEGFVANVMEKVPRVVSLREKRKCDEVIRLLGPSRVDHLHALLDENVSVMNEATPSAEMDNKKNNKKKTNKKNTNKKSLEWGFGKDASLVRGRRDEHGELWTTLHSPREEGVKHSEHAAAAFDRGYSLVVNKVEARSKRVYAACSSLEKALGLICNANIYYTPPPQRGDDMNQGFEIHWDEMDSIIVQLYGEKTWDVWNPMIPHPLAHQRIKPNSFEVGEPVLDSIVLRECDILYMPRGWIHAAKTTTMTTTVPAANASVTRSNGGDNGNDEGNDDVSSGSIHVTLGLFTHLPTYSFGIIDAVSGFLMAERIRYEADTSTVPASLVAIGPILGTDDGALLSCGEIVLAMASAYANQTLPENDSRRAMPQTPVVLDALSMDEDDVVETLRTEMLGFFRWAMRGKNGDDMRPTLEETLAYIVGGQRDTRDSSTNRMHPGPIDPLLASNFPGSALLEWAHRLLARPANMRRLAPALAHVCAEMRAVAADTTNSLIADAVQQGRRRARAARKAKQASSRDSIALHTSMIHDEL